MGDDFEWTSKKIVEYHIPPDFRDGEIKRLQKKISKLEDELKSRPSTEYVEALKRRLEKKQESEKPTYQAYAVHDGANAKVEVGGTYYAGRTFWDFLAESEVVKQNANTAIALAAWVSGIVAIVIVACAFS